MIVEECLKKFFNYQLSGLDRSLNFFKTQMNVMFLALILYDIRSRCLCHSMLSIPSSHRACLDFTKRLSIHFFPCCPVCYPSETLLFLV